MREVYRWLSKHKITLGAMSIQVTSLSMVLMTDQYLLASLYAITGAAMSAALHPGNLSATFSRVSGTRSIR